MKSKIIVVLLIITIILGLTGCKKKESDSDIVSFKYSYGSGMGASYDFNIEQKNDEYILTVEGFKNEKINVIKKLEKKDIEELSNIIDDNNIKDWDGFDKSDKNVYDGYGFTLEVKYKSGEALSAHGYMKYPKDYDEGHEKLEKYLLKLIS